MSEFVFVHIQTNYPLSSVRCREFHDTETSKRSKPLLCPTALMVKDVAEQYSVDECILN